jgi:putative ABC transport system permease protein
MFARVLQESFSRAKGRHALAITAVALGTAVATAMLAVFLSVGDRVSRDMRSFGANISVTPASDTLPVEIGGVDYRPVGEGSYLSEDLLPKLKTIFWRNNIMAFAPFLYVPVTLADGRHAVLVGTWFDHEFSTPDGKHFRTGVRDTNPTWKVDGTWPAEFGKAGALVGRRIAVQLHLRPGDMLPVAQSRLEVSGILSTGGGEEDQVFVPLAFAQKLANEPGKLRRLQISALTKPEDAFARRNPDTMNPVERDRWYCTPYVSSIAYQIQQVLPGAAARQVRQVAQNEGEVLNRISWLMLLVTIAALAAAALAVSSSTATVVIERRSEIALMKAIGSSQPMVGSFFVAETALQGLIGGTLGYLAGYFLAGAVGQQVFGVATHPPIVLFPLMLVVAVAVSWAGAFLPLNAAVHFSPAAVLKEERT